VYFKVAAELDAFFAGLVRSIPLAASLAFAAEPFMEKASDGLQDLHPASLA
jgi:hypothetical protein